ncbi:hypothetical protein O7635_15340 [Asanoa sp. WMMD1127]|uniref:hypothetical protein n=1 Tax=Asanoa sp. WMMD1127 TaxID=3016107 RepID=UPI00241660D4|nr:hypothetical protein [Asanoa sp. WMMD1127]MDG4823229.1 hypothetical protein [Asanoa sp. WMMD1127]
MTGSGARRPMLAILVGLAAGTAFAVFVFHEGLGRTADFGEGSFGISALLGLVVAAGSAWTIFHKGW